MFEDQSCVHEVHRCKFQQLLRQIKALQLKIAAFRISLLNGLQVGGVDVHSHNTLRQLRVDVFKTVSASDAQYCDRLGAAQRKSFRK